MGIFNISYSVSFIFEKNKIHKWVFSHKDYHSDTRKDTSNQSEGKVQADPYQPANIPALEYGENIQGQHKSRSYYFTSLTSLLSENTGS